MLDGPAESRGGHRGVEAAEALDESYPETSRPVVGAPLGLGIVNSGKSKQYATAVEYLSRAKRCFTVAGLPGLLGPACGPRCARITTRKAGFIREFEKGSRRLDPRAGSRPSWRRPAPAWDPRRTDILLCHCMLGVSNWVPLVKPCVPVLRARKLQNVADDRRSPR